MSIKIAVLAIAAGLVGALLFAQSQRPASMPDLGGAVGWLNSSPLKAKSLRGKVVLINFWTYTCINSLRPMPYVRSWAAKYEDAGLVVIGVHTPESSWTARDRSAIATTVKANTPRWSALSRNS